MVNARDVRNGNTLQDTTQKMPRKREEKRTSIAKSVFVKSLMKEPHSMS